MKLDFVRAHAPGFEIGQHPIAHRVDRSAHVEHDPALTVTLTEGLS